MIMKFYDYYRSTACYRVRIVLALKAIAYEKIEVHLVNQGGEQHHPDYNQINPQELIPTLIDDGMSINQSLAIIDYLNEKYPHPAIYPSNLEQRTQVKSLSQMITCDIHPLNNLRVLQYLVNSLTINEESKLDWYQHWIKKGFDAIELQLAKTDRSLAVCVGNGVSLADICLIPQVYNAHRFNCPMEHYPLINEINNYCLSLEHFKVASP